MVNERVVVIGGANMDVKARMTGIHAGQTSHPGLIWCAAGGVGHNIAVNLAALHCAVTFIAPIGHDSDGDTLAQELQETGIDADLMVRVADHPTGRYVAVFTDDGELQVAVSDMAIMDALHPSDILARRDAIRNARLVCVDANLSGVTLGTVLEVAAMEGIPVVVQPVSVPKAKKLLPYLAKIQTIVGNRLEIGVLSDMPVGTVDQVVAAARTLRERGVSTVIATMGSDGVCTSDQAGERHYPAELVPVVDVTGAGDAFTAGVICGYCRNLNMDAIIRLGQSLSKRILTSTESVLKGSLL